MGQLYSRLNQSIGAWRLHWPAGGWPVYVIIINIIIVIIEDIIDRQMNWSVIAWVKFAFGLIHTSERWIIIGNEGMANTLGSLKLGQVTVVRWRVSHCLPPKRVLPPAMWHKHAIGRRRRRLLDRLWCCCRRRGRPTINSIPAISWSVMVMVVKHYT